ncbi:recombinase family protein [Metapseudomonas boanensis]|uniref:Recombinase family protein n=1 Tax=Metapseudomonas boanensis TaxID=2822138 RepID=A0ABS5XAS1_9GAMM|nr:recombinase family protein [Pseudomonas boanensis]MBT8764791.1 recombinase family protein [Pseudomonas boanensis]
MDIGYARTSTIEQEAGFEAQLRELELCGCEKIFKEQVSSVAHRAQLDAAIEFSREGDTFVVTKLDRLARSIGDLLQILRRLELKLVEVRILNLGLDTSTPTGKLILTVLGGVAEWERTMMLERQREGIAKAKKAGKYKGRKPIHEDKRAAIVSLAREGVPKARIAQQVGVGQATVYRALAASRAAGASD